MIGLLQLMLTALIAGATTIPADMAMGGCHERIDVPGFGTDLILIQIDGELQEPGTSLREFQSEAFGWVGLACWAPGSGRFVTHADDEPGIRLVQIATKEAYAPLRAQMEALALAQRHHRENTGSYSDDLEDLGLAHGVLSNLNLSEENGWSVLASNSMLHCELTSRMYERYAGEVDSIGGCGPADDREWVRPLREFWEEVTAEAIR